YNGADSFTYTANDGNGASRTATVSITVNSINDGPSSSDDSGTVNEDGTILVDILVNDIDVEGDTISIDSFTQGINGTVTQEGDSLRYEPDDNYSGFDSFTYSISDGNGGFAGATVNITVNPVNDTPVVADDSATLSVNGTYLFDVLVNDSDVDGDTLSITEFTQGSHGTVTAEGDSLRYTPDTDYSGTDSFTYTISDGNGGTASATVNATIQ
ncbi:MAG: tandem-95 repeat protein, partial [Spirochaetales bacterium]|nr:tandem-95 repeat protein [Spirochaetales bacterium]